MRTPLHYCYSQKNSVINWELKFFKPPIEDVEPPSNLIFGRDD